MENPLNFKFSVELCKYIYDNVIGKDVVIKTPFGNFNASGKNLKFIEAYLRQHVLPLYGNTHSDASCCAEQTTKFREEARKIIKRCVNANEKDVVLFVGSGSTATVHKLINALNLKGPNFNRTTVVLSALEHHSNLLPWKETGVEVIRIPMDDDGSIDIAILKKTLKKLRSEKRIILCTFSAASNVSGVLTDTERISTLVHNYGGYVFWDYAAAAPYNKIDMNSSETGYKDAVFISAHKFVGGPGSPGVLIAKYYLFQNPVPSNAGGGSVITVTKSTHVYMHDIESREEGGTPEIIGSIRAGLAFQLKNAVTPEYIEYRDHILVEKFFGRFSNNQKIVILGNNVRHRLPIFSFLVVHQPSGLLLHHNFVSRLLNDLFGIQSRPGCACAGPYSQDLLNIEEEMALKFVALQTRTGKCKGGCCSDAIGIIKPGFARLNLPYFFDEDKIKEVLDAVQFIVENGWYFLPQYTYEIASGTWIHRTFVKKYNSLNKISYNEGRMYFESVSANGTPVKSLMSHAMAKLKEAKETATNIDFSNDPKIVLDPDKEKLRWFILPSEASEAINSNQSNGRKLPFIPLNGKAKVKGQENGHFMDEKDKIYISKKTKNNSYLPLRN